MSGMSPEQPRKNPRNQLGMADDKLENIELTYKELLSQNEALSMDLQKCLLDKELVWNLWKKLQVENPNTASIINSVIESEQEKSDAKDLKVLKVLQEKDRQMSILQELCADLQTQLNQANERVSGLLMEEAGWERKYEDIVSENNDLKLELDSKSAVIINKEKQLSAAENEAEDKINESNKKVDALAKEIELYQQNVKVLSEDLEITIKERNELKGSLLSKEENIITMNSKLYILIKEKQELLSGSKNYKSNVRNLEEALYDSRKEVGDATEYWQYEVRKNIEIIHDQAERLEDQQQELISLNKRVGDENSCLDHMKGQANIIERLERQQKEFEEVLHNQQRNHFEDIEVFRKKIQKLKKKLSLLQKENNACAGREVKTIHHSDVVNDPVIDFHYVDDKQDNVSELKMKNENIEVLSSLVNNLENELSVVKKAHGKRLQRYRFLEENCMLLREQIATYEEHSIQSALLKDNNVIRASSKSLQREGSKSVWNELEYYRTEFEKMKLERPKLDEELDVLRVETIASKSVIDKLKLKISNLGESLKFKCIELSGKEKTELANISKIESLENVIQSAKENSNIVESNYNNLKNDYNSLSRREYILREKLNLLHLEMKSVKSKVITSACNIGTQTSDELSLSGGTLDEVMSINHNKETSCQTELATNHSLPPLAISSFTQTKPHEIGHVDCTTQTESKENENSYLQIKTEISKLDSKESEVDSAAQQLLLGNKILKKKRLHLQNQVKELEASERSLRIYVDKLEDLNRDLKNELVETLKKLKETTNVLDVKTKESEGLCKQLKMALTNEKKGSNASKNMSLKLKSFEKEVEVLRSRYAKLDFQVKTLTGENDILSKKQKNYQERVGKLEKEAIQKNTRIDDLKIKCDETKSEAKQRLEIIENLNLKLKALSEKETKGTIYIEELNSKVNSLEKDKSILQKSLSLLKLENKSKAKLLDETQWLCHEAEIAVTDIQHSAYQHIDREQQKSDNKQSAMIARHEKYVKQILEFRSCVKDFSETLISKIHENQAKISDKKKLIIEEKQSKWLENKVGSNVSSILKMSATDLQKLLNEDTADETISFKHDNDIRRKLDIILSKEVNFGKLLVHFLLDLVQYNESLYHECLLCD